MKTKKFSLLIGSALLGSAVLACMPMLTTSFLRGAHDLLRAPEAWKQFGLGNVHHAPAPPRALEPAVKATNHWEVPMPSTFEVDVAEFARVIEEKKLSLTLSESLISNYQSLRLAQLSEWEDAELLSLPKGNISVPARAEVPLWTINHEWPEEIPAEFRLYVEGVARLHEEGPETAREAWEDLLRLPLGERIHRSAWAAWMLYKTAVTHEEALHWLSEVCRLIEDEKCSDSLRMQPAALSLLERNTGNPSPSSLGLYYHNAKANRRGVYFQMLLDAARSVARCTNSSKLVAAARDPAAREIITEVLAHDAGLLPGSLNFDATFDMSKIPLQKQLIDWCSALEAAKAKDEPVMSAVGIALYRVAQYELARNYLALSEKTWETLWIQGKLELQRGRSGSAAAKFSEALRLFPKAERSDIISVTESVWDNANTTNPPERDWLHSVRNSRFLAECGAVRLSQSDFVGALRLFLDAKCPHDAAYVVDHLMSADEILDFVGKNKLKRSPKKPAEIEEARSWRTWRAKPEGEIMGRFLYVVARRLARDAYFTPARALYPWELLPLFDRYVTLYRRAQSCSVSREIRARCLMEAARFHHWCGMELFAAEGDPDAAFWEGSFPADPLSKQRWAQYRGKEGVWFWEESGLAIWKETKPAVPIPLRPSSGEISRLKTNMLWGRPRFHYREVAAQMAREASHLLPTDSEEAAMMLAEGGCWVTPNDGGIDPMFEELIARFAKTKFAQEADRHRWYPEAFRERVLAWSPEEALKQPLPGELAPR